MPFKTFTNLNMGDRYGIISLLIVLKVCEESFTINANTIPSDFNTSYSGMIKRLELSNLSIKYSTRQRDIGGESSLLFEHVDDIVPSKFNGSETYNQYSINQSCDQDISDISTEVFNSSNKRQTQQKFSIQIRENYTEEFVQHASTIGFVYVKKIAANVHLFEYANENEEELEKLGALISSMSFRKEVLAVGHYTVTTVIIKLPEESRDKGVLSRKRRAYEDDNCFPYHDADTYVARRLGYSGRVITIAVVDNGVDINHPDLTNKMDLNISKSFVESGNILPSHLHSYREYDGIFSHGTMAAGLIVGKTNNVSCTAGIAQDVKIAVLKVTEVDKDNFPLGLSFNDEHVPTALGHFRNEIDIYSCSFTSISMFMKLPLQTKVVLREGVEHGRHGKGNIFVFSSGNKGRGERLYDCNGCGYSNSIYTITISSVGPNGSVPNYAIPCSCILASTFGDTRASGHEPLISTALKNGSGLFSGTSAAAAKASAIIAMTLEARPSLNWRDIQQIIVFTSSFSRLGINGEVNNAGLTYDPHFGFGLMNATAMVKKAKIWTSLRQINVTIASRMKQNDRKFKKSLLFTRKSTRKSCLSYLEHVVISIRFTHLVDKVPVITLCSPRKTCSILLHGKLQTGARKKKLTESREESTSWDFMSVKFWGENPVGRWSLEISNFDRHTSIEIASMTFYGTHDAPFSRGFNPMLRRQRKRTRCAANSKAIPPRLTPPVEKAEVASDQRTLIILVISVVGVAMLVIAIIIISYGIRKKKREASINVIDSTQPHKLINDHDTPR